MREQPTYHLVRARVLKKQGQYQEAINTLKACLNISNTRPTSEWWWAASFIIIIITWFTPPKPTLAPPEDDDRLPRSFIVHATFFTSPKPIFLHQWVTMDCLFQYYYYLNSLQNKHFHPQWVTIGCLSLLLLLLLYSHLEDQLLTDFLSFFYFFIPVVYVISCLSYFLLFPYCLLDIID